MKKGEKAGTFRSYFGKVKEEQYLFIIDLDNKVEPFA
jgi:hypothetical protein